MELDTNWPCKTGNHPLVCIKSYWTEITSLHSDLHPPAPFLSSTRYICAWFSETAGVHTIYLVIFQRCRNEFCQNVQSQCRQYLLLVVRKWIIWQIAKIVKIKHWKITASSKSQKIKIPFSEAREKRERKIHSFNLIYFNFSECFNFFV